MEKLTLAVLAVTLVGLFGVVRAEGGEEAAFQGGNGASRYYSAGPSTCSMIQEMKIQRNEKGCEIECYPYDLGMQQIDDRLRDGENCDTRGTTNWALEGMMLKFQYTCQYTRGPQPLLCMEAPLAIALTNLVGESCIPNFRAQGMWRNPSTADQYTLGCLITADEMLAYFGQIYTYSYTSYRKQVTDAEDETDAESVDRMIADNSVAIDASSENATTASHLGIEQDSRAKLTCVSMGTDSACRGHVWRAPVKVNGECVAVCASAYCSSDFTFNYCLRLTLAKGQTNAQCTADSRVRRKCFG